MEVFTQSQADNLANECFVSIDSMIKIGWLPSCYIEATNLPETELSRKQIDILDSTICRIDKTIFGLKSKLPSRNKDFSEKVNTLINFMEMQRSVLHNRNRKEVKQ